MDDRKLNNCSWIVEEFSEWLDKAVDETAKLKDGATGAEHTRLAGKNASLKMVQQKLAELKYE